MAEWPLQNQMQLFKNHYKLFCDAECVKVYTRSRPSRLKPVQPSIALVASQLVKPHPVFPASNATAGPEHCPAPFRPAQHPDAQSALLKHWPVMNWLPSPLPTFAAPGKFVFTVLFADPPLAAAATAAGGATLAAAPTPASVKPQPVLPLALPTAGPEQTAAPLRPAQQPDAQSALLKHWPVMNCEASPLPTFAEPGMEVLITPAVELGSAATATGDTSSPAAAEVVAGGGGGGEAAPEEPVPPKPQPVLPAWNCAPGPEQIPAPLRVAQQAEAQSAWLRQAPPMNWMPLPLPTFLAPAGSGERGSGFARAVARTEKEVS
jgi:hypothetical protein